jgi:hypothetical protein
VGVGDDHRLDMVRAAGRCRYPSRYGSPAHRRQHACHRVRSSCWSGANPAATRASPISLR